MAGRSRRSRGARPRQRRRRIEEALGAPRGRADTCRCGRTLRTRDCHKPTDGRMAARRGGCRAHDRRNLGSRLRRSGGCRKIFSCGKVRRRATQAPPNRGSPCGSAHIGTPSSPSPRTDRRGRRGKAVGSCGRSCAGGRTAARTTAEDPYSSCGGPPTALRRLPAPLQSTSSFGRRRRYPPERRDRGGRAHTRLSGTAARRSARRTPATFRRSSRRRRARRLRSAALPPWRRNGSDAW